MGRLIYSVIASLDGYVEDATGAFGWAEPDAEVLAFVNDLERPIATYLYGRRMYDTTTVVSRGGVGEWLAGVREGGDDEIVVYGSRTMWNGLLAAGLVDELHLMVGAVALGDGTPVFSAPVDGLTLLEARRFEGSENVVLRYAASGR